MTPVIKELSRCAPVELYALFRDVYSSSDAMSEVLEEQYPDPATFEQAMAVLRDRPGAIALAAVISGRPVAYVIIRPAGNRDFGAPSTSTWALRRVRPRHDVTLRRIL